MTDVIYEVPHSIQSEVHHLQLHGDFRVLNKIKFDVELLETFRHDICRHLLFDYFTNIRTFSEVIN